MCKAQSSKPETYFRFNIEGKITECWLVETEGIFSWFCFQRGQKLLTPDWSSSENTCSWLAEHAISTFRWFLHFVQQEQQQLSGSLEFLTRIVHAKNTWKSSATAKRKCLKANFRFLEETAKYYLCQKLKTWSDLFGWKLEIIHGHEDCDQVLSSCCGFCQHTISGQ